MAKWWCFIFAIYIIRNLGHTSGFISLVVIATKAGALVQ